jgi:SAM-dependent methyltransferase
VTDTGSAPVPPPPADRDPQPEWVVTETLDRIRGMSRFNAWLFEELLPHLGSRVLEVGSGIGNFSEFFFSRLRDRNDLLVLSDISEEYLAILRDKYGDHAGVQVEKYPMESPPTDHLLQLGLDTVVALNVLEHVEDDGTAIQNVYRLLVPGGRLVVLAPAYPQLYCDFDRLLGHHRRYRKEELVKAVNHVGFSVRVCRSFNFLGAWGWFLSGKVFRRKVLPRQQLRVYDMMVPVLRRVERWIGPPFGLSLFLVAEKPEAETETRRGTQE